MSRLLLLLLVACAGRTQGGPDTSLPDGAAVESASIESLLDGLATDTDPTVRGRALAGRVRAARGDQLQRWWMQASYDPDPFVQRLAARAVLDRLTDADAQELLVEYATRASGDPYVRLEVVEALLAAGKSAGLEPLIGAWKRQPVWRAAPLAWMASRVGDAEAGPILVTAVASGEVRDDPGFVAALGQTRLPGLGDALAQAVEQLEELGTRLGFARALLGEPGALEAWRTAVAREGAERDAVELVLALPADQRARWVKEIPASGDGSVKAAIAVLHSTSTPAIDRALRHRDPWVRQIAVRLLRDQPEEQAVSRVLTALADDIDEVRVTAADVASGLGDARLKPALAPLLADDHAIVRAAGGAAMLNNP